MNVIFSQTVLLCYSITAFIFFAIVKTRIDFVMRFCFVVNIMDIVHLPEILEETKTVTDLGIMLPSKYSSERIEQLKKLFAFIKSNPGILLVEKLPRLLYTHDVEKYSICAGSDKQVQAFSKMSGSRTWIFCGSSGESKKQLFERMLDWNCLNGKICVCDLKIPLPKQVDYARLRICKDGWRDKRFYDIQARVKNFVNHKSIKFLFHRQELSKFSKFMPESYTAKDFSYSNTSQQGKYWLYKPIESFAGSGHVFISSEQDWKRLKASKEYKNHSQIQQYIANPLLLKLERSYKFHYRCYFALVANGETQTWDFAVAPIMTILHAKKPWNLDTRDLKNPHVHDTHAGSTSCVLAYPSIISDSRIKTGVMSIMEDIKSFLKIKSSDLIYPESKHGYEIFAPDILFDEDFKPYLLEINNAPGFNSYNLSFENVEKVFFSWEYAVCIEPFFSPITICKQYDVLIITQKRETENEIAKIYYEKQKDSVLIKPSIIDERAEYTIFTQIKKIMSVLDCECIKLELDNPHAITACELLWDLSGEFLLYR